MARPINQAGLDLIKGFEGFRDTAYLPTPNDVWTIGYGHTSGVKEGDTCTPEEAEQFLVQDLDWAEQIVENSVLMTPFTDNQYAACVSLCFNIGGANFMHSSVLRALNAHDPATAAQKFLLWDMQAGTVLRGLQARRQAEVDLFNTP